MLKHVFWGTLAMSCLVTGALSLSACEEVESCKPGSEGCIDGPPKDGKCKFDLVLRGGKCVESDGKEPDKDSGTDPEDSGPVSVCGSCDEPLLCVAERKLCVDFCATPEEVPGSGTKYEQIRCGGEMDGSGMVTLSFAETCKNTCLLTCRWQNWFCSGAKTDCASECEKPYVQADCALPVTGCVADLTCQKKKCTDVRALGCIDNKPELCPKNMIAPVCEGINCSNACADAQSAMANTFDGYCDDGAYIASDTNLCPFGTDCADCGPRTGAARPVDMGSIQIGEPCPSSARCTGRSSDYDLNKSWCLPVVGDVRRCLTDCSGDGETCPAGFECIKLNTSMDTPLLDRNGRRGSSCYPTNLNECK